jgi:hypothetical protein
MDTLIKCHFGHWEEGEVGVARLPCGSLYKNLEVRIRLRSPFRAKHCWGFSVSHENNRFSLGNN